MPEGSRSVFKTKHAFSYVLACKLCLNYLYYIKTMRVVLGVMLEQKFTSVCTQDKPNYEFLIISRN